MTDKPNLARLLDGVPRFEIYEGDILFSDQGTWVTYREVLAALSASMPADVAGVVEEAGKVLEELARVDNDSHTRFRGKTTSERSADLITALLAIATAQAAQVNGLEAENKNRIGDLMKLSHQMSEWKTSQHYRYIGADGKPVLARDLEARAEAAETALAAERAKVARLVDALREARSDLASYVDHDYPPETRAAHPSVARQHFRDMELCRRIDAILSEAEARDE